VAARVPPVIRRNVYTFGVKGGGGGRRKDDAMDIDDDANDDNDDDDGDNDNGDDDAGVDVDYTAMRQMYCNIVAGACLSLGIRFAGSGDANAARVL
jgi:hypothetical protein